MRPAEQWLRLNARVSLDDDGNEVFVWPGARPGTVGYLSVFLAIFGDVIDAAIVDKRDPLDALRALPEPEKRGWGSDFERWAQHRGA